VGDRLLDLGFADLRRTLFQADPSQAAQIVERHIQLVMESSGGGPGVHDDLDNLFPRIVGPSVPGEGDLPWEEEIIEGRLHLRLVADDEHSLRFLRPMELVRTGVSVRELRERARANLEVSSAGIPLVPAVGAEGAFLVSQGDGHDASRLLVAHHWFPAAPGVFCLAPARDVLWVVPGNVAGAISVALRLVDRVLDQYRTLPYPVSPSLFWKDQTALTCIPVTKSGGSWCADLPEEVRLRIEGLLH
jgi:hypothetical protein